MENAVEALEYAFAVFVLIIALSLSFAMFGKLNDLSEDRLSISDQSIYYDPDYFLKSKIPRPLGVSEDTFITEDRNRVVKLDQIIPTIYGYYKEHYIIEIDTGDIGTLRTSILSGTPYYGNSKIWNLKEDVNNRNTFLGRPWANDKEIKDAIDTYVREKLISYAGDDFREIFIPGGQNIYQKDGRYLDHNGDPVQTSPTFGDPTEYKSKDGTWRSIEEDMNVDYFTIRYEKI